MALSIRQLAEVDHAAMACEFEQSFATHIGFDGLGMLAFYWPMIGEADPRAIIHEYLGRGGKACLPKAIKTQRAMSFYEWKPEIPLVSGDYGIPEPDPARSHNVTPDTVIVPMLLINLEGQRIGFGGGHYDATLASLRAQGNVRAIGLAYDDQIWEKSWDVEPHDQVLDLLLTPTKCINFKADKA